MAQDLKDEAFKMFLYQVSVIMVQLNEDTTQKRWQTKS